MALAEAKRAAGDIESFLAAQTGGPVSLFIETVAPEQAPLTMADQERVQREDREETLRRACLASEAVRLAERVLGASVRQVVPNMESGNAAVSEPSFNDFAFDGDDSADD